MKIICHSYCVVVNNLVRFCCQCLGDSILSERRRTPVRTFIGDVLELLDISVEATGLQVITNHSAYIFGIEVIYI